MQSDLSSQSTEKNGKTAVDAVAVFDIKPYNLFVKRAFDIIASFFGLVVLSPVLLLTALMIQLDSRGPVFFRQTRIGRGGKMFKICKFRTMAYGGNGTGLPITALGDTRITRAGRFLRKYKLDELPQLFNVLRGEMSFVGPRPEVEKYVALYNDFQKKILTVKPGITDYASISYIDESALLADAQSPEETYINDILPRKIELNMEYLTHVSLLKDIEIIFRTIFSIVKVKKGEPPWVKIQ